MFRLSSIHPVWLLQKQQQRRRVLTCVATTATILPGAAPRNNKSSPPAYNIRNLCAAASSGGGGGGNRGGSGRGGPPGLPPPAPPPPSKNNSNKKRNNIDKKLFQPAQKGQLQHNKNFIPKLLSRKPHANIAETQKRPQNVKQRGRNEDLDEQEQRQSTMTMTPAEMSSTEMMRRSTEYQAMTDLEYEHESVSDQQAISCLAYELDHDDDKESYWCESFFEDKAFMEMQYTGKNPPGMDLDAELQKYEPTPAEAAAAAARKKRNAANLADEDEAKAMMIEDDRDSAFFKEFIEDDDWVEGEGESFLDSLETEQEKKEVLEQYKYTVAQPIQIGGHWIMGINPETLLPLQYETLVRENPHPDLAREPKPHFFRNRRQPSLEFVEGHRRFLYVTGLPRFELDGARADLDNPVHWSMMQKNFVRLLGVESKQVSPANSYSAFIGFHSPEDRASLLFSGPTETFLSSAPSFHRYTGSNKFANESTLLLLNIPPGNTSESLLRKLFPEGSEIHSVYGTFLTPDDVLILSSKTALIRFNSAEAAESILESSLVSAQLEEIGKYPIRFRRARRELVHERFGGPGKSKGQEFRKLGPRLIVDGDMPTRSFYTRHAGAILLGNLDLTVSKEEITRVFQPYCAMPRDKNMSIEIVTCWEDIPVGQAYVGFDKPGEAEAAINEIGRALRLGDRKAWLSLVKMRLAPFQSYKGPDTRPERPIEELLRDLTGWEQYVDPADIQLLEDNGVSKQVLDDALRNMRFNNHTFSVLDQSIRDEALEPEKRAGQQYKDIVQLFIKTLIECLPTKENPGELYPHHFAPEEQDIDSMFEKEKERQELIRLHRARPQDPSLHTIKSS
jgi:hypothetical protein